jgi:hypothetical protein
MATTTKKFLYVESHQIPLTEIPYGDLKENMMDPITKKPYKGIVMEGCCADLSTDAPNNNKRFYDIPTYLELVQVLRKQIFSEKGVYGELEHPASSYAIDTRNVSHKLLDIWYVEAEQKVYIRLILLNTPNGFIAQEIVRSGGQLAISARAAGEEKDQPDGTKICKVKLMTTYDLVYHPGFSAAVLKFKELNESQKFLQEVATHKIGFSGIIYDEDLKKINKKFEHYIGLNEHQSCFYEWFLNDLSESQKDDEDKSDKKKNKEKDKEDIDILAKGESSDQQELEDNLTNAVKKDLSENKNNFFQQVNFQQNKLKRKNQGKSYFQGAAGFIKDDYSIGIE